MVIPKRQMQSIVEEIGAAIHRNISFMDESGCIIASTDQSGAETSFGINLPIVIENQMVGAIGIDGESEGARELGKVIKKMTEMLILEQYRNNQKRLLDEMKKSFAIEWLFGDNEEQFMEDSHYLKIDPQLTRVMAIADIEFPENTARDVQGVFDDVINYILREYCDNPQQLVLNMGMKVVFFFEAEEQTEAGRKLEALADKLEEIFHCGIFCGTGLPACGRRGLRQSYKEAEKACELAKLIRRRKVECYSESDVRLLFKYIPEQQRSLYLQRVLRNTDAQMIQEMLQCLRAYLDSNGSIYKAAESLYIHKNTLQYRLNKIKQVTGHDPRILSEAIPLYIAMILNEFAENKQWEM